MLRRSAACSDSGVSTPRYGVAVEHRDPAGVVGEHRREGLPQRRPHRHPGLHPAGPVGDRPGPGRLVGGDPAVQGPGGVEHHGPPGALGVQRGACVRERVGQRSVGGCSRSAATTGVTASRVSPRSAPTKSATNGDAGEPSTVRRGVVLLEHPALAQDRDPVAEPHRLGDVVGDEDDRLAQLGLQPQELLLQPAPGDRVDRPEGLVHEQHRRVRGQRPGHADPLPLAAGELVRVPASRARPCDSPTSSSSSPVRARVRRESQPSSPGTVRDVVGDRLVREQPHLLDDVADPTAQLRPGRTSVTSSPSSTIRPLVGSISRLTIFMVVVLPQPDGPTSTHSSPAGTSRLRASTTVVRAVALGQRGPAGSSASALPSTGGCSLCWPPTGRTRSSGGRGSPTTGVRSSSGCSSTSTWPGSRCSPGW